MKKFTLPAKVVKAANLFRGVNDVRYYLNGFLVSANDVLATDGHTLICCKLDSAIENHEPAIIKTVGNIPAKCYEVEFVVSESGRDGTGFCKCRHGSIVGVIFFEVIDGKFPEKARSYLTTDEVNPISKIGINCKYFDRLYKAALLIGGSGRYGLPAAALTFNGEHNSMKFDIKGSEHEATVVIMPMRL